MPSMIKNIEKEENKSRYKTMNNNNDLTVTANIMAANFLLTPSYQMKGIFSRMRSRRIPLRRYNGPGVGFPSENLLKVVVYYGEAHT